MDEPTLPPPTPTPEDTDAHAMAALLKLLPPDVDVVLMTLRPSGRGADLDMRTTLARGPLLAALDAARRQAADETPITQRIDET